MSISSFFVRQGTAVPEMRSFIDVQGAPGSWAELRHASILLKGN